MLGQDPKPLLRLDLALKPQMVEAIGGETNPAYMEVRHDDSFLILLIGVGKNEVIIVVKCDCAVPPAMWCNLQLAAPPNVDHHRHDADASLFDVCLNTYGHMHLEA